MGTLMRSPGSRSAPQTLTLPAHYRRAPGPSAGSEPVQLTKDAARPAKVVADAPNNPGVTTPDDDSATRRTEEALDQCTRLQTALDELHDDLQQHRDAAHAQGHESGLAEGRIEAQTEAISRAQRLNALLEQLEQQRVALMNESENEIAEAVFSAVGKILGKNMTTRRGAAAAVRQVCKQIANRNDLVVRVTPTDLEFLSEDSDLFAALGGKARFEADANVVLGGCLVESGAGTLDGRLETQINRLQQVLMRSRDKRHGNANGDNSGKPGGSS